MKEEKIARENLGIFVRALLGQNLTAMRSFESFEKYKIKCK